MRQNLGQSIKKSETTIVMRKLICFFSSLDNLASISSSIRYIFNLTALPYFAFPVVPSEVMTHSNGQGGDMTGLLA